MLGCTPPETRAQVELWRREHKGWHLAADAAPDQRLIHSGWRGVRTGARTRAPLSASNPNALLSRGDPSLKRGILSKSHDPAGAGQRYEQEFGH